MVQIHACGAFLSVLCASQSVLLALAHQMRAKRHVNDEVQGEDGGKNSDRRETDH